MGSACVASTPLKCNVCKTEEIEGIQQSHLQPMLNTSPKRRRRGANHPGPVLKCNFPIVLASKNRYSVGLDSADEDCLQKVQSGAGISNFLDKEGGDSSGLCRTPLRLEVHLSPCTSAVGA